MLRRGFLALLAAVLVTAVVLGVDLWLEDGPPDQAVVAVLHAGTEASGGDFGRELARVCPDCTLLEEYAAGGQDLQGSQLDLVLSRGADVVVLEPVTPASGEALVHQAGTVPVIAVGTLVPGADHFVGHDARTLGRMVTRAADVPKDGRVLLVADTDAAMTSGAEAALSRADVVATLPADQADRPRLRAWLQEQVATTPTSQLDAIITLDDDMAGTVVDVLAELGVPPESRPAVTGVGSSLAGVRRVVLGTQQVAGYVDVRTVYAETAVVAATLAVGAEPEEAAPVDGVPTVLVLPQVATLDTVTDTVVRRAGVSIADLCRGETARRCTALGIR